MERVLMAEERMQNLNSGKICLQLRERMLAFDPKDRPIAEQGLFQDVELSEKSEIRLENLGDTQKGKCSVGGELMVPESESVYSGSDQRSFVRGSNEESQIRQQRIHIKLGKDHRISYPDRRTGGSSSHSQGSGERRSGEQMGMAASEVSHLGWGHWYTMRELEVATNGFAHENVIGEGGYGIVYKGVLEDETFLAVKNLLNNRGQAEREFKVEVEAIRRVRHKNLVRLLGYCAEGAHREEEEGEDDVVVVVERKEKRVEEEMGEKERERWPERVVVVEQRWRRAARVGPMIWRVWSGGESGGGEEFMVVEGCGDGWRDV
ncbi:hypothetical protein Drorol1_Dr00022255 [Drosera rotundifolia]